MELDVDPDIWVPRLTEDRLEAVNPQTGEHRYGEEARLLLGLSDRPAWYVQPERRNFVRIGPTRAA